MFHNAILGLRLFVPFLFLYSRDSVIGLDGDQVVSECNEMISYTRAVGLRQQVAVSARSVRTTATKTHVLSTRSSASILGTLLLSLSVCLSLFLSVSVSLSLSLSLSTWLLIRES